MVNVGTIDSIHVLKQVSYHWLAHIRARLGLHHV